MIKFGDFEPIDVSISTFFPLMNEIIVEEKSLVGNQSCDDHVDDEGWSLVTQ